MYLFPVVLTVLTAPASGTGFPPPPPGVHPIDRALVTCSIPGEDHTLYISLYNQGDSGTIEIQSGVRLQDGWYWESVCTWQPRDNNGNSVLFDHLSVLIVRVSNASVLVTWTDDPEELMTPANPTLDYNVQWRGHEEF